MSPSERIQAIRKKTGLIQADFAKKIGVSRATVINWEKGATEPSSSELEGIVKIFDFTTDLHEINNNDTHSKMDSTNDQIMKDAALGMAFKTIMEGGTEYTLIPKSLLQDKHRIQALEQFENDKYIMGRLLDQNEKLIARVLELEAKLPGVEKLK